MKFIMTLITSLILIACSNEVGVTYKYPDPIYITEVVTEYVDSTKPWVDTIIEPESPGMIDILVVIDRSCSMDDDGANVGLGMAYLASTLDLYTDEWQIGFISMDSNCTDEEFVGPYNTDSALIDITLAPSLLNMYSCPREEGFAATYTAIAVNPSLQAFLRPDADLMIWLVSDEEEQSSITAPLFKDWLDLVKEEPSRMDITAIANFPNSTCNPYSYYTDVGMKYIELMTLYNKNAVDICSDFTTSLAQNSLLTRLENTIKLTYYPIESSIVVLVDGVQIPSDAWSYVSITNEVAITDPSTFGYSSLVQVLYAYDPSAPQP